MLFEDHSALTVSKAWTSYNSHSSI